MELKEITKLIGKEGVLVLDKDGFAVNVTIQDVKQNFGRVDVLVVPVSGTGEKWTNLNKLTLKEG